MYKRRLLLLVLTLAWIFAACAPSDQESTLETPGEPPGMTMTLTPTLIEVPSETPVPTTATSTSVPTATETPIPLPPMISSRGSNILCLFGPGEEYAIGGSFMADEEALVLGRDEAGEWFQIEHPRLERKLCWLSAEETVISGDVAGIPVVPPPENIVTIVTVSLHPSSIELSPCNFPAIFDVNFSFEVTGPTSVSYRTYSSEGKTDPKTLNFSAGGLYKYSTKFEVNSAGDHYFKVTVLSPNGISGDAAGRVTCP